METTAGMIVMRPPRVTIISETDYHSKHWKTISSALMQILQTPSCISISQEEIYRTVYNVCCQRHMARLCEDIIRLVTSHLESIAAGLSCLPDHLFLRTLVETHDLFVKANSIIDRTFRHLDKMYILEKQRCTLAELLTNLWNKTIISGPIVCERLAHALRTYQPSSPSPYSSYFVTPDPAMMATFTKNLYEFEPGYTQLNPHLFAMFIPCLQRSRGLEEDMHETQIFVNQMATGDSFHSNCWGVTARPDLKRKLASE